MFQLSYTFSKALDDQSGTFPADYVSESGVAQNFSNPNGDYGRSSFDRTDVFVGNFLYELPFGARNRLGSNSTGFRGKLVGGWRLGGIVSLVSGPPFTANLGSFNNSENGANFPADRPDRSEEHTSELQSPDHLVCRLLLEKKKNLQC